MSIKIYTTGITRMSCRPPHFENLKKINGTPFCFKVLKALIFYKLATAKPQEENQGQSLNSE
jgi:hypothetical protein